MDATAPPVTITPLDNFSFRSLSSIVSSHPSILRRIMDLMDLAFMPCEISLVGVSIINRPFRTNSLDSAATDPADPADLWLIWLLAGYSPQTRTMLS